MTKKRFLPFLAVAGMAGLLMATPALAGNKTGNTLLGAGLGAVVGAVISDGDAGATIGGAAVGGLLGNIATSNDRHYHSRGYYAPPPRYVYHAPPPPRYYAPARSYHVVKHHGPRGYAYGHHKRHHRHYR